MDGPCASAVGGQQLAPGVSLPPDALSFSFARSSGPGGQNVNKLATKARLRVDLPALRQRLAPSHYSRLLALSGSALLADQQALEFTCQESRSQESNKRACLAKLRDLLVQAMRPVKSRRPTRPTRGSRLRRAGLKRRRSAVKDQRKNPPAED